MNVKTDTHTFVIPAYKESPYLEECILNLLNQTIKSSIIVTTSTPSAFSEQIARKYGLDYFINDTGAKGIAADWNFALSKVTTPWATIAHQDDIYAASYTQNVLAAAQQHDTLIAFTNYYDLVNNKIRTFSLNALVKRTLLFPFTFKSRIRNVFFKKLILVFGDPVCCPSVTFHLEALKQFEFLPGFTCILDWQAWYTLAKRNGSFCYINKKLVTHRIHSGSETTAQLSNGVRHNEEMQMFKMIWGKRWSRVLGWLYAVGHADNET